MPSSRSAYYADQSDPAANLSFRRRWLEPPMTAREMQHAADLELAHGNAQRADLLAWRAHIIRTGASS